MPSLLLSVNGSTCSSLLLQGTATTSRQIAALHVPASCARGQQGKIAEDQVEAVLPQCFIFPVESFLSYTFARLILLVFFQKLYIGL